MTDRQDRTLPATVSIPEGFVPVPITPTEAMMHAAQDVPAPRPYGAVYRAMLDAAPNPPTQWDMANAGKQSEIGNSGAAPSASTALPAAKTYTREEVQKWRDDIAHAAADMVKRAGNDEWKWLEGAIRALAAAPTAQAGELLFCDLKTDEQKANFFLSGRAYESGVIARAIQNDVAMAYQRCANYAKELAALAHAQSDSAGDARAKGEQQA